MHVELEPNELDLLIQALRTTMEHLEGESCDFDQVRRRVLVDKLLVAKSGTAIASLLMEEWRRTRPFEVRLLSPKILLEKAPGHGFHMASCHADAHV